MDSKSNENELGDSKALNKKSTFIYKKCVKYSKTKNTSKCLIKYCSHVFKGRITGNIKKHFERVHNLIVNHKSFLSGFEVHKMEDFKEEFKKYFDYYPLINKTLCKFFKCNEVIEGKQPNKLIEHYKNDHHIDIKSEENHDIPFLTLKDVEDYDVRNNSYVCLYRKCDTFKVKDVEDIKKHYLEMHDVIIKQKVLLKQKYKYRIMAPFFPSDTETETEKSETEKELPKKRKYIKKKKRSHEFEFENYVQKFPENDSSKCLLETCDEVIKGLIPRYIQRHYFNKHYMCIMFEKKFNPTPEEHEQVLNKKYNESFYYPLEEFVTEFCNEDNLYKCMFENCEHSINKELMAIKNHYLEKHKILIIKTTDLRIKCKVLNFHTFHHDLLEHHVNILQKQVGTSNNTQEPKRKKPFKNYEPFKIENYVFYRQNCNISKCLIKNCKSCMTSITPLNIKRHFLQIHSFKILQRTNLPQFEEIKRDLSDLEFYNFLNKSQCLFENCNEILNHDWSIIQRHYYEKHKILIDKHIANKNLSKNKKISTSNDEDNNYMNYDFTSSNEEDNANDNYFKNYISNEASTQEETDYNELIPKRLKHNPNAAKILPIEAKYENNETATNSDNTSNTKEKCLDITSSIEEENINDNIIKNNSISNESSSHEETDNEPISKRLRPKKFKTEKLSTVEKTLSIDAKYKNNKTPKNFKNTSNTKEKCQDISLNSTKDILIKKPNFFVLCLGLTIQYDLPLEQFDDAEYLKPLLEPYEKYIDCDLNMKLMEAVIIIVNRSIADEIKNYFCHRIICLELFVLRCQLKNYVIFNVRYLAGEKVENRIIGFLPVTVNTTSLPISEFLNKYNINEEQVYMKTISASFQDNEEIVNICNNLLKHNTDLKTNPLYELQLILKAFKEDYAKDVKHWQILTNYKDKFIPNIWQNLKDLAKHVKSLIDKNNQLKPKLKDAKNFFKTLQIFWNFYNKLAEEQYIAGDFYRDLLTCELELQNDIIKNNNKYAEYLKEKLTTWKDNLMETNEFLAALYLDVRFNFLGTRLINEGQHLKAKEFLVSTWERYNNVENCLNIADNNTNNDQDDEYALLDQYFNDNTNVNIKDKLTIWIPPEKESFGFDILNFWRNTSEDMLDVKELMKITYTFSASQYILKKLQQNFTAECTENDRFLIKFNFDILEEKGELIFKDLFKY